MKTLSGANLLARHSAGEKKKASGSSNTSVYDCSHFALQKPEMLVATKTFYQEQALHHIFRREGATLISTKNATFARQDEMVQQ